MAVNITLFIVLTRYCWSKNTIFHCWYSSKDIKFLMCFNETNSYQSELNIFCWISSYWMYWISWNWIGKENLSCSIFICYRERHIKGHGQPCWTLQGWSIGCRCTPRDWLESWSGLHSLSNTLFPGKIWEPWFYRHFVCVSYSFFYPAVFFFC